MLALLQKVRDILINEPRITAHISKESIGSSLRQPAAADSIEFELSDQDRGNISVGKQTTELIFHIHSESGTALCYEVSDILYEILTHHNLGDLGRGYRVDRVRQVGLKHAPRNGFNDTLTVRYALHISFKPIITA